LTSIRREQENQLNKSIVENLQIFVFRKDRDSKFTYANDWFFRQSQAELRGAL